MGKGKLEKFADMHNYTNVVEYPYSMVDDVEFDLKGLWGEKFFKNSNPIILELGCGRGEYTIGLAQRYADINFIGVDIKGARMWTGATQAKEQGLKNVGFLRAGIEVIDKLFSCGEVKEIWITFPDPQMKKYTKRMTSTLFLGRYAKILGGDGIIHLKTDSNFMFTYTRYITEVNSLPVLKCIENVYSTENTPDDLLIKTYYESQWLTRGIDIKYISFLLPHANDLQEPNVEIELDEYRSYNRNKRSGKEVSY